MSDDSKTMTTLQAAEYLDVDISLVQRLAKHGRLKGSELIGREWKISKDSVEEYKRTRKVGRPVKKVDSLTK